MSYVHRRSYPCAPALMPMCAGAHVHEHGRTSGPLYIALTLTLLFLLFGNSRGAGGTRNRIDG